MYEALIQRLRSHNGWALNETLDEAADAIEDLSGLVDRYGGETGIKDLEEYASEYWDLLKNAPRWTLVTEKLPDKDGQCLCWLTYIVYPNPGPGETRVCCDVIHFDVKSKSWLLGFKYPRSPKVLAWMPLPEPPKEET